VSFAYFAGSIAVSRLNSQGITHLHASAFAITFPATSVSRSARPLWR
jgi:hypothetical protein